MNEILIAASALVALISAIYSFMNRGKTRDSMRVRNLEQEFAVLKAELEAHRVMSQEHYDRLKSDIHDLRRERE